MWSFALQGMISQDHILFFKTVENEKQQFIASLISAKNSIDEAIEWYHSIESIIQRAQSGELGPVAKSNADIVYTNMVELNANYAAMLMDIKQIIQLSKIVYFNAQWAIESLRQDVQQNGLTIPIMDTIEICMQQASGRFHSLIDEEKRFKTMNNQLIIETITQLKDCVYYIKQALHMVESFPLWKHLLPTKFISVVHQYASHIMLIEGSLVHNARNSIMLVENAKKYALKVQQQSADQTIVETILSVQQLHI